MGWMWGKAISLNKIHHKPSIPDLALLIILSLISLTMGRYALTPNNFMTETSQNIFWNVRLPRVVMAVLCGGALGTAGCVFQILFRNVLASPEIVGVSSGAGAGAAFAMVAMGHGSSFLVPLSAFAGGMAAVVLVMLMSRIQRGAGMFGLVISGVVVGSICNAIIMLFKTIADPNRVLPSIEFWLMGGLYTVNRVQVLVMLAVTLGVMASLYVLRFRLTLMSLGDDDLITLGMKPYTLRLFFLGIATLLVAVAVSFCGVIGWIGLLAPYISRLRLKKASVGMSFLYGAILLLVADTLARSLTPAEIPVGIVVSLLGAPMLLYLLRSEGHV